MIIIKWAFSLVSLLILAGLLAGQLGFFKGTPPSDLGVRGGRLKPPSNTRNSVSSQASLYLDHPQRDYADIAPLPPGGAPDAALARIGAIIEAMGGATIVAREPGYLYAQFTSRLMKYVDDVEFWFDPAARVIHVRSASRLGSSDFGVNRKRIEFIRHQLDTRQRLEQKESSILK